MNWMLFLICLWLAFLGGLEGRAWGMALPGRDAFIHAYEERGVVVRGLGAGPSEEAASVARGWMTGHGYGARKPQGFSAEIGYLERMQDGPNLYAYVKQNPWSKFDPLGLEKNKAGTDITRDKNHVSPVLNVISTGHWETDSERIGREFKGL
ncbi:hypothetical protein GCM10023213_33320 [Prosthecobacter algae]|uniref:Uncharacterized protein n=1 Tax=Prosthecobacter algae TaxID=1144682 RepID=A0ABP9PGP2_9BACT